MNFGNKEEISSKSGVRIFSLAVFALLLLAGGAFAAVNVTGDWPNDDAYRVEIYDGAQTNPCDDVNESGTILLYNSSTGFASGDALFDSNNEYNGTFTLAVSPTTMYIYLCRQGDGTTSRASFTRSTTSDESLEIDFGKAAGTSNVAALRNKKVHVCDALTGGNNTASVSTTTDAGTGEYQQYYYMVEPSVQVNGGNKPNLYIFFDDDDTNKCTFDNTKLGGLHVIPDSALPYDYGVYITDYSTDTVISSAIHADIATLGYLKAKRVGGDNEFVGMTGQITSTPFSLRYKTFASGSTTVYAYTAADTTVNETITGVDKAATTLDLSRKISGNVPSEVSYVETTISGITYNVSASSNQYKLYVPDSVDANVFFKSSAGATLYNYTMAVNSDETLGLGKVNGTVHSGVTNVRLYTDNACTDSTGILSTDATPATGVFTTYILIDNNGATGTNLYPMVSNGTLSTCEPTIGFPAATTYAIEANYTIMISGTVSAGISTSGGVILDLNGNDTFEAGIDPYTKNFSTGVYRLFVASQSAVHNVTFFSNASLNVLELRREKTASTDTTVNVAQVNWSVGNIHTVLNNSTGIAPAILKISNEASAIISSETRNYSVSDSQFYEVPATGTINLDVYTGANILIFYARNYTPAVGESLTFEPYYNVTLTAPASASYWDITKSSAAIGYYRASVGKIIYVDKTLGGAGYTYDLYNSTRVLSRGSKDTTTNDVWNVNTVNLTAVHADLVGAVDPVVVYTTTSDATDCGTATALSSTTSVALTATNYLKYYEKTDSNKVEIQITNATTTCINTLTASAAAGGNNDYAIDVRTSGNMPSDIDSVRISSAGAVDNEINSTALSGTPYTYAIYWAGGAASNISYYDGGVTQLNITGRNLGASVAINVGKVLGNSHLDINAVTVYSGSDCTTAVSTEPEAPGADYVQYFEHAGSVYVSVADATYTTCKRDALTVVATTQEAHEHFDRIVNGTVPANDGATTDRVNSTRVTIRGTTLGYTSDTVIATDTYKLYVNTTGANATSNISFYNASAGSETILLSLIKDFTSDATVNVSAVYGATHNDIEGAGNTVAVCYGTMPTNNSDCSTKASTEIIAPSSTSSLYEIFFEQEAGVTPYYVMVKDSDAVSYYSWNNFTSAASGTISQVVLSGKYSGSVRQSYDTAKTIGNVLVKMYDDADPSDANALISTTYTYDNGTTIAPTGNFTMYGTTGTDYNISFSKASYITQSNVATGALSKSISANLSSGISIHVITQETGAPTNITDAIVSMLDCTDASTCNADTALGNVCTVAGVANQSCTITGDGTAGKGLTGMYYFAGIPDGTKVKLKVVKSGYTTYSYPSAYDDPANNFYTTSSTAAISRTVEMTQATPACTLTAVGGSGTYTASGQLYTNATGVIVFTMDCSMSGLTVTGNLSSLGGSATQAFAASGTVYTYALTASATTGTKTVTVVASTGSNNDTKSMNITVDTAAPTVSSSSPSAAQNTRSVTITATTDTAATCRYSASDVVYSSMTGAMAGADTLHEAMVLATNNATNHYYVRCIDMAGNAMAASTDISFPVDAVAPSIVNATPAYSATPYRTANVGSIQIATDVAATCKWGATDANYSAMTSAATTVAAGTLTTLTGASAASGLNMIYVRCMTTGVSAVEMSSSGLISFNYDSTAPTYELTSVTSNGGMSSGGVVYAKAADVITVKFTASETINGTVTVTIGGAAMAYGSYLGGIFTYTATLAGTEVTSAIIDISGGSDAAGNMATTYNDAGANAQFDFTAPVLTAPLPTTTQNSRSFQVSVNGGETANLTCRYSTNNVAFAAMEGTMADLGTNVYSANAVMVSDGSTTVYFACRDLAGNVNTSNTGAFSVLSTAPTVTSFTPQGGYYNSTVTATLTTSAAANCSWSTVDGTSYAAMAPFTSTGGTTHTASVNVTQGVNHIYALCTANGVNMTSSLMSYFNYDSIVPSVYEWGYSINRTGRTVNAWILSGEALNQSSLMMTFDGSNMSYFFGNGTAYTFNYTYGAGLAGVHNITVSACTDMAGNACVLEPVYFPLQITIDEDAPGISTSAYSSTTWMLQIDTNESAVCMYSIGADAAYANMPYAMSGSGQNHTAMVHPHEGTAAYNVYVACMDSYGNTMGASQSINIASDTIAPSIINSAPSGIYTSLSAATLEINTSEAAACQYKTTAFAWGNGTNMTNVTATKHTASLGVLADGTYSYYVLCQDTSGNSMASGFPITFVVNTVGNFNYTYSLNLGWNSVWLPRVVLQNLSSFADGNYSTVNVLNTRGNLTGFYNYVYFRNGTSCSSQNGSCWLSYDPAESVNDLTVFNDWDNLPYWINMNASGKRLAFQ